MIMVCIITAAYILDLIIGDPQRFSHPVVLIGKLVSGTEKTVRNLIRNEIIGGVVLTFIVAVVSFFVPLLILTAAGKLSSSLAVGIEILFCYQIFAAKSLKTQSMKVYYPLAAGDIEGARKTLSLIVGRDTEQLDEAGIIKAAVETIAENTTDGVISPLLYMAIGGAPLGFLYKAVNTMDSMIGYRNERYNYFGRFAARLDDVCNFVPARLAAWLMIAASMILRLDYRNAVRIYFRDRKNHKSPNSAQTESVCAGALQIQLAGDGQYFGKHVQKPTIGENIRSVEAKDIVLANRLMYMTSFLGLIVFLFIRSMIV